MNASVVRVRCRRASSDAALPWCRSAVTLVLCATLLCAASVARAQPSPPENAPAPSARTAPPGSAPAAKPGTPSVPVESVDNNQTLGTGNDRPWANGVTLEAQALALKLFREGNSSLNDGVFRTAAKLYRDALAHWDHPAIHYNLALALMNLDQPIEVYQSLNKALKYNPKDGLAPLDSDKYDRAKNYMLLAQKQVAYVDITCDKPGAKVAVDGNVVFIGPGRYQGLVRIGKHSFVAEKEGYVTSVEAPYIGPGETMRFALTLYSAKELTRYRRRWSRTWFPWSVAGGGGALAIAAGVLYASGRSDVRDFDARITRCGPTGCPITAELTDMRDRASSKQTLAWVGVGVGTATIAAGVLLAYINRVKPYQIRPEDLAKESGGRGGLSSLSVTPIVTAQTAGAAAWFRF